jgi:hypothetical protein
MADAETRVNVPTPPPPSDTPRAAGSSPAEADRIASDEPDAFAEKPHVFAAGALAGGFVLAKILNALFGSDDD